LPGVFLLSDNNNTLVSLEAAHFVSEDDFQVLLAKFPELLAGDQIDPSNPRRWVLVRREAAIPSEENSGGRWSLDHLFLDQDGVPTLVEVKRQTDTRIRREVVGQMLDYAANCVVYLPVERLKMDFEATCHGNGTTPAETLSGLLGPEPDIEDFWLRVKTNLAASRVRLLFVSDVIPPELRRIIEFLNKNMDPTEVLGLELRQFQGRGLRTMVPLVVGQTEEAVQRRNPTSRSVRNWDEDSFFAELGTRASEAELQAARGVVNWMKEKADHIEFGKGQKDGSIGGRFTRPDGPSFTPILLYTYGRVEFQFQWMKEIPYFDTMDHRRDLMHRLNGISGISIGEASLDKRPATPLTSITSEASQQMLVSILNWAVDAYKSSPIVRRA
jgi:hypothetical protein